MWCLLWYKLADEPTHAFSLTSSVQVNADALGAAQATLKGLKNRYAKTGSAPVFIQTVGHAL